MAFPLYYAIPFTITGSTDTGGGFSGTVTGTATLPILPPLTPGCSYVLETHLVQVDTTVTYPTWQIDDIAVNNGFFLENADFSPATTPPYDFFGNESGDAPNTFTYFWADPQPQIVKGTAHFGAPGFPTFNADGTWSAPTYSTTVEVGDVNRFILFTPTPRPDGTIEFANFYLILIIGNTCVTDTTGCQYQIDPTSAHFGPQGGTGQFQVLPIRQDCCWSALSNNSWIHITAGSSGCGYGTVHYSVDVNSGVPRTGTITAAGLTFTVTQDSCSCDFTLTPPTALFDGTGFSTPLRVSVTFADQSCEWTAAPDLPFENPYSQGSWIRLLSDDSYIQNADGTDNAVASVSETGDGMFYFVLLPNLDGMGNLAINLRTGTITVVSSCNPQVCTITQAGQEGGGGGGGPGVKTPGGNPWCLHDRYGRFHVVTAGGDGIRYFRSDGATPLADSTNPDLTNGWELAGAMVASGGSNPHMAIDFRDRLHLVYGTTDLMGHYVVSDDDGTTWSTQDVPIPNALKPTIAAGHDGTLIIAAFVPDDPANPDDGGSLQATIQGPGDMMPSEVFPFLDQDGSIISAANDTFHLSNAFEGPNRWVLAMRKQGETVTSIWYTAQDTQAEDGTAIMQWAQISEGS